MLIIGLGTGSAKVQFRHFATQSQIAMQEKKKIKNENFLSNVKVHQFSTPTIHKVSKVAFRLSNYLEPKAIFGSLRANMLQQSTTRLFEYASTSRLPASEESTSLIYPRARMYEILKQEILGLYKGKSSIDQVGSAFLWMTGAIAMLMIYPYSKMHPLNLFFVPQQMHKKRIRLEWGPNKRVENTWEKRIHKGKTVKTQFNLLAILSKKNEVFSTFSTFALKKR